MHLLQVQVVFLILLLLLLPFLFLSHLLVVVQLFVNSQDVVCLLLCDFLIEVPRHFEHFFELRLFGLQFQEQKQISHLMLVAVLVAVFVKIFEVAMAVEVELSVLELKIQVELVTAVLELKIEV